MTIRKEKSFCRICAAGCGIEVTIENDRPIAVRGDRNQPMTKGYACFKGVNAAAAHTAPDRILHTLKRMPDGSFERISAEKALDEIAEKLRGILDRHGPESLATYWGCGSIQTSSAAALLPALRAAVGTTQHYATLTIDQSAKFVAAERMGAWAAGKPNIEESDMALLVGCNPLVAHSTAGFLVTDPTRTMKRAKERGLKLIVIDPRRSEIARYAEIFLQPYPGEDASILSGLLRIILANGWENKTFCESYVKPGDLDRLRAAVEPFNPSYVARRAGIDPDALVKAAHLFATAKKGAAFSGTGPSMSPHCNVSEQLVETLNVICGRYRRPGDKFTDVCPWLPPATKHAEVIPPVRSWEKKPPGRIRGARSLAIGERFTCNLPDEILVPGEGQVRALINAGGNPASSFPDQVKTVRALKALDLLISIEPLMTNTAKLSDYIFAPKMMFERADLPFSIYGWAFFPVPWAQYQPELVPPPASSELVDEWTVYWGIAKRLGLQLSVNGVELDMVTQPTTEEILRIAALNSVVPLEEIKQYPGGKIFDIAGTVQPARAEATGKFEIMADDVMAEMAEIVAEDVEPGVTISNGERFAYRLAVRRNQDTCNSWGVHLGYTRDRMPSNPGWMNPKDIASMGVRPGERIKVQSDHGAIVVVAQPDETVRQGVIQITHCWGGLPGDGANEELGASTNLLISSDRDFAPINSMARMSAIPVNITPA